MSRRNLPNVAIIARVLGILALAAAPCVSPRPPLAAATAADSLSARWSQAMVDLHVPGMSVIVVNHAGTVRNDLLGLRDVENGLNLTPDTRIYIASCTKPFVACVAALLATEGTLDLDAPVRRYLPRFTLADAGYADSVTVRDLLCHRPGIVNSTITLGDAYTGEMTEDRYYRLLGNTEPRRRFTYSNLHYTLVGRVIEAVTGQSWKEVITERVFLPVGMTRTTCSASEFWAGDNIARPYEYDAGHYVTAEPLKADATMHAAGGIITTSADLARWLRMLLGNGMLDGKRVFPAAAIGTTRELLALDAAEPHPLVRAEQRLAWGAGWDIRTMNADTLYCHNGNFPGCGAFLSFMPGRDLAVAVLANGSGISVFLAELVAAEAYDAVLYRSGADALPQLLKIAERKARTQESPAARGSLSLAPGDYAGKFYNDDWGTLVVTLEGDSLNARIGVLPLPIALTGVDCFDAGGYPGRFDVDGKGRIRAIWLNTARPDSARFERMK
ncbi:MAG: beta-lactamase family protein [Candidatus Krumholzibacteria bacterium]|nr:beta-lactamase family protein [Candidatus Krumholzibacteria bacterium]MDH4338236.1 beta-lactamase family protein [Candidatus Krumholzibacteria bacterium]MDH5270555.1 beta-lactamase family protein [Candidatus Krumholzibacteria bacterium]MDH5626807.1 beta-lactamase family protein [Candidatus Krumholzibacteria bacterium]